jgi:hypothetical protein
MKHFLTVAAALLFTLPVFAMPTRTLSAPVGHALPTPGAPTNNPGWIGSPAQVDAAFVSNINANFGANPSLYVNSVLAQLTPLEVYQLQSRYHAHGARVLDNWIATFGSPTTQALWVGAASNGTVQSVTAARMVVQHAGADPNLDYTLEELYLDFRTASGGMSVSAALGETLMFIGMRLSTFGSAGFAVGTGVSWVLEEWAPDANVAIGGTIAGMITQLGAASTAAQSGQISQALMALLDIDGSAAPGTDPIPGVLIPVFNMNLSGSTLAAYDAAQVDGYWAADWMAGYSGGTL